MRLLPALLVLTSCYSARAPLGVPCGEDGACPRGQVCDLTTNLCGLPGGEEPDAMLPGARTLRDDTAADFANGVLVDAVVEAGGFIAPMPYATGRVRVAGYAGDRVGDPAAATWASITSAAPTGRSLMPTLDFDFGDLAPTGIGLGAADNITVTAEGEIYFDVIGMWRIELEADDKGFVDVAAPGADFVRVVSTISATTGIVAVSYLVTTPGWHRVRAACADLATNMELEIRVDPPNVGGSTLINPTTDMLRARVDDLTGFLVDGFDELKLNGHFGATLENAPLVKTLAGGPYGLNVGNLRWSLRWTGQILVDVEGDYAFRLDTVGGHRMWLDGVSVANAFTTAPQITTTTPQHLVPGWHDVVIDLNKDGSGDGRISLTVASGPAWATQTIPTDRVRPLAPRAARWLTFYDLTAVPIPDGSSVNRTLTGPLPASFTPLAIDVAYGLDHPQQATVTVDVNPPAGADMVLLAAGQASGAGAYKGYATLPSTSAGASWVFTFSDTTVDAVTGELDEIGVSQLYNGGVAPFPATARFESAPRDLGSVVELGALTWQLRQGTMATAQVRSCDDETACASEPWTTVAHGAIPAVTPRRFLQYAVSITTNGDVPTALDWIELAYTAQP